MAVEWRRKSKAILCDSFLLRNLQNHWSRGHSLVLLKNGPSCKQANPSVNKRKFLSLSLFHSLSSSSSLFRSLSPCLCHLRINKGPANGLNSTATWLVEGHWKFHNKNHNLLTMLVIATRTHKHPHRQLMPLSTRDFLGESCFSPFFNIPAVVD